MTQQGSLHMYQGFYWGMFLVSSLLSNAKYIIVHEERKKKTNISSDDDDDVIDSKYNDDDYRYDY